jgi:hypothetical protein
VSGHGGLLGSDDALTLDLKTLIMDIEREEDNVDRAYNALPADVRKLLESSGIA